LVSDDPVGRLDFECPAVKAFQALVQDELRTSGLSGRDRFDAQMARMVPFARVHTRTCVRCRQHAGATAVQTPALAIVLSLALVAVLAVLLYFHHPTAVRGVSAILAAGLAVSVWFAARR
jgi:hypothetical protein